MTNTTSALSATILSLTLAAGLAGCSDDAPAAAVPAPAASTSSSLDDVTLPPTGTGPVVLDDGFSVPLAFDAPPAKRYRINTWETDAMHWLPHDVATDEAGERWADLALYTVLRVHDPETGEPLAGPAERAALRDLPAWFRSNPTLEVLAERRVEVGGARGFQLDVRGTGAQVVGSTEFEALELGEAERFTFWKVDGHWLCLQASTLRGRDALRAEENGDVYDRVLRTMRAGDAAAARVVPLSLIHGR